MNARILALAPCAIAIAGLWAAAFHHGQDARRGAVESTLRANANLAMAYEEGVAATLESARALMLAAALAVRRSDAPLALDEVLADLRPDDARRALELGVVDATSGQLVAGRGACLGGAARREPGDRMRPGELRIGEPALCRATGKWMIPLALRIERRGDAATVAIAAMDAARLGASLARSEPGPGDVATLLLDSGTALVRRDARGIAFGDSDRDSPVVAARTRGPDGVAFGAEGRDGVRRYYSYRTLERFAVTIAVGTSESDMTAAARRVQNIYLLLALMTSALVALTGARIATALVRRRARSVVIPDTLLLT